jgi:hypothetical protein
MHIPFIPTRQDVPEPTTETTSVLLRRILAELEGEKVSIEYIILQLRRRSFGGIFLLFAALGLLPGISFFAGLIILIPALQMALGLRAPLLPAVIGQRKISVSAIQSLGNKTIPWIEKIESYIKPRWFIVSRPPMPNLIGILTVGLAMVIMLPLPFSNFPPALALLCLSLGLMERDGVMMIIGLCLATIALIIGGLMFYVALETILLFLK